MPRRLRLLLVAIQSTLLASGVVDSAANQPEALAALEAADVASSLSEADVLLALDRAGLRRPSSC